MVSTDLNAYVKAVASLANVAGTGSAQNGTGIDRQGYQSAVGILSYSTSGGVTGGTITAKFQHSDAQGSGFEDYGAAVTVTLSGTNPSGVAKVPVNLAGAKRYVRLVVDSDPTGGTPASNVAGVILLGGASQIPAE